MCRVSHFTRPVGRTHNRHGAPPSGARNAATAAAGSPGAAKSQTTTCAAVAARNPATGQASRTSIFATGAGACTPAVIAGMP